MNEAEKIVEALEGSRFSYQNEVELQDGVAEVLVRAGLVYQREHRFTARDRVDFFVADTVALEVKVAGAKSEVLRQLLRYAEQQCVEAVVLLTPRSHHQAPASLAGKPVHVVHLGGIR